MSENLPALQIGRLHVSWPVFLAPMAGYGDAAFRSICLEQGCGCVITEMTNAYGLMIGHLRTSRFLDVWDENEHPVGAQIYGSDPGVMAEAAARVAEMNRFEFLDINAGCPMPKIRNRGDGAGLMRDPQRLYDVVRGCVEAADSLPVTVKTRIGWDAASINIHETSAAIEEAGAAAIFLHGRVASVQHSGDADWPLIAEIKQARTIPVIGNGGIRRAGDAFKMRKLTGVDGVMIGRAALGNPWIFQQIREMGAGHSPGGLPAAESVRTMIANHLQREIQLMKRRTPKELRLGAEITACLTFRAHLVRYLHGFRGLRTLAQHLEEKQTPAELLARVDDVLASGRKCDVPPPQAGDST